VPTNIIGTRLEYGDPGQ